MVRFLFFRRCCLFVFFALSAECSSRLFFEICGRVGNNMPGKRRHFGQEKVGRIGQTKTMATHIPSPQIALLRGTSDEGPRSESLRTSAPVNSTTRSHSSSACALTFYPYPQVQGTATQSLNVMGELSSDERLDKEAPC